MKDWILKRYALCLIVIAYLALRLAHLDFVPLWDARQYYNQICLAVSAPFDLLNYCPWGHSSLVPFLFHGAVVRLFPESVTAWNLSLLAMSLLGIFAFYRVVRQLAGSALSETEAALATALFAFEPAILANNINFSLDLGLTSFYFVFLWLWNEERFGWATLFATGLLFTKEPGLLLFGATILTSFLLWQAKNFHAGLPATQAWLKTRLLPIATPLLAFVIYLLYRVFVRKTLAIFYAASPGSSLLLSYLNFLNTSPHVQAALLLIFVLSFAWVLMIPAALGASALLIARLKGEGRENAGLAQSLSLLLLISYLLSRFATYANVRYYLVGTALLVLTASLALGTILRPSRGRPLVFAAILGLFLLGDFRSVDPVSRFAFGTIPLGEHPIYRINSITRECCGIAGRDQLIYNLEFLKLHSVQNKIYESIRPTNDTYLLADSQSTFLTTPNLGPRTLSPKQLYYEGSLLSGQLDPVNFHRTMQTLGSISPRNGSFSDFQQVEPKPQEVYFIAYPLFDNRFELQALAGIYPARSMQSFDDDGYKIDLYRFAKQ